VGAAFANGWAANGFDSDDGLRYAYGHGGAQIFPAALAVAESCGLSGKRMLAAMVVGYEVAHRAGRCWHDSREVYQACGSWGSVACAATAANLMELTPDQAMQALGIAEYFAPNLPMMRDIDDPAMVKHGIGWGAMTGIVSAGLASQGFTGIPSILGFETYRDWVSGIGDNYIMVDGVGWKERGYACCGWAHAAAKGARSLVDAYDIALEDVATIRVDGFHETVRLGVELPTTTEEAQFSVAWPVAAMLLDGEIGPAQTLEPRLEDPEMRSLAKKVELVESEELNELRRLYELGDRRGRFASKVTIVIQDGTTFDSGLVEGSFRFPASGWSRQKMEEKFRWLARFVLDDEQIDGLLEMVWHLEDVPSVAQLTDMVSG
jgi:2-methylcitrate dehydratase PrpD